MADSSPPEGTGRAAPAPRVCFHCGAGVAAEADFCPACGGPQTVECDCGQVLRAGEVHCPHCGAQVARVVRVKRRTRRNGGMTALGIYMLVGAAAAIVLGLASIEVIAALAQRGLGPGYPLPSSLWDQLPWAWQGLQQMLAATGGQATRVFSGMGLILVLLLVGVVAGLLVYLIREQALPWSRHLGTRRPSARRRRME